IFKLVPQFLCAPTQKTCLATDNSCGQPAPGGNPVPHFKCYKVAAKECPNGDCSGKLTGRFVGPQADLVDQFGGQHVTVGTPTLLCAPVTKTITGGTTPTTLVPPPTGQADHLKCYMITGGAHETLVHSLHDAVRVWIFKLVPQFICAPTVKTCLATDGSC